MIRLLTVLSLMLLTAAMPPRLISDLSQNRIDIEYSFSGAELLIFGAIQYPGGRMPREKPGLAIILRGPPNAITVREKEKVAGIWINTRSVRFESAPSFYSIATTAPIAEMVDERTAAIYELGLSYLQLSPASGNNPSEIQSFERGLLDLRQRAGVYRENPQGADLTENVLYRARIPIPAEVPVGGYTAEIHLIEKGEVVASTTREIVIEKSGFERAIYLAAQHHSMLYGALAVLIALSMGWLGGAIVRR